MDLVTYPRLPLSTKIFNFTEYIPRTWWETIRSVFKFNYWFKLSLNPRASSASLLQKWKRETERSVCGSGTAKLHFQHCLSSKYCVCAQLSMKSNNSSVVRNTANQQQRSFVFAEIPLRSTARHSFIVLLRTEPRQTETNHIHTHTLFPLSKAYVWVWLSGASPCSHHCGFLWNHSNPSITGTTSHTLLRLWGIFQVGEYIFRVSPPYRFTWTPLGLKSCCCTPGEVFSPNETQDQ